MKEMKLGRILVEKRHKKGITQEELAAYLGVSKAAVSKWENEMTYPDITLLPQFAAYFNITIDDLLGYESQMSKAEIQKCYTQLAERLCCASFSGSIGALPKAHKEILFLLSSCVSYGRTTGESCNAGREAGRYHGSAGRSKSAFFSCKDKSRGTGVWEKRVSNGSLLPVGIKTPF